MGLCDLFEVGEFRPRCEEHKSRNSSAPTTVYGLPIVEENPKDAAGESEVKESTGEDLNRRNEASGSDDGDQHGEEGDIADVPDPPRRRGDPVYLCGNLTMDPDLFLKALIPVESRGQTSFFGGCV